MNKNVASFRALFAVSFLLVIAQSTFAGYIGKMDNFWRRGTMVDVWLKGGGGLITIPSYVQSNQSDFPYIKRSYPKEYPFADEMILVRVLGGWANKHLGKGEAANFTDMTESDFAWYNGSGLSYNKSRLINRIRPYVDAGYEDLTIVMDNIPWGVSDSIAVEGNYGNKAPAKYNSWMYWVGRRASQYLVEEFGATANNFTFRFGTETEWGERFTGNTYTYFKQYDECTKGIRHNLPNAPMGPGNFFKTTASEQTAVLADFLGYIESEASANVSVDYIAASRYFNSNLTGSTATAWEKVNEVTTYLDELENDYGNTVLANATFMVDEFGVLGTSREPGAFGGALKFEAICRFLDNGIDKMQHWKTFEDLGGGKVLFDSEAAIYSIFDHLKGRNAYVQYINGQLSGNAKGMALIVKGGGETYVIMSSVHKDRSNQPVQNFNFTFNKSRASFSNANGVNIEYLSLDSATSLFDIIRDDLDAEGLLQSPYTTKPDLVNDVGAMGGTDAKNYVKNNWSTYENHYINSLKLKNYSGSLTENGNKFVLSVQGMKTPSVMVFRLWK